MARHKPFILFACILMLSLLFALVQISQADKRAISRIGFSPERRVALVIGNSRYNTSPLRNPANDAKAMAESLQRLGFEVILGRDLDQKEMKRAIWDFGGKLKAEGVGLFFYAGHGVQVDGLNYLIPVQARIRSERDAELEAVDVRYVINEMARARTKLNILILDACRDNPFARSFRSGRQGLATMNAPQGTVIAYATAPDQTAADGSGSHSPFTNALLKELNKPGLKLEDTFKKVGLSVSRQTLNQQRPWLLSNYYGDFFFKPRGSTPPATSLLQPQPRVASASSSSGEGYGPPESTDAEKIADLLAKAEAHLKVGRLTTPKEAAAVDFYRMVLREEPGNTQALDGLHRIVGRYVKLARGRIKARDWDRAETYLNRAATVSETDDRILAVRDELREARTAMTTTTMTAYVAPTTTTTLSRPPAGGRFFTNSIGMKFVKIPGRDYYMGIHEVTQSQWQSMMGSNPSHFKGGNRPVDEVSWDDAREFIRKLNAKEGTSKYRLPTEAEWEYAARAGSSGDWCFGNDESRLGEYAWYDKNSGSQTHPVGQKRPNAWGLYDMHGNVWEWCRDLIDGRYRVNRGGSWDYSAGITRSAVRSGNFPDFTFNDLGFRLTRTK